MMSISFEFWVRALSEYVIFPDLADNFTVRSICIIIPPLEEALFCA